MCVRGSCRAAGAGEQGELHTEASTLALEAQPYPHRPGDSKLCVAELPQTPPPLLPFSKQPSRTKGWSVLCLHGEMAGSQCPELPTALG